MNKTESPSDVIRWLETRTADAYPAILGSLSLRRAPCIRANCQACLSGEQHQSWVLYGRAKMLHSPVAVPGSQCRDPQGLLGRAVRSVRAAELVRHVGGWLRCESRVISAKAFGHDPAQLGLW